MFESFLQDIRVGFRVLTQRKIILHPGRACAGIGHRRRYDNIHGRQCLGASWIFFSTSGTTDECGFDRSPSERTKQ